MNYEKKFKCPECKKYLDPDCAYKLYNYERCECNNCGVYILW